jgi:hypothetical protein
MPAKKTVARAKADLRSGKSPSTAAGEFVREEVEQVRERNLGARSPRQAIAIGPSKARRAGVPLPPPRRRASSKQRAAPAAALKREPRSTASKQALSKQAATRRRRARAKSAS